MSLTITIPGAVNVTAGSFAPAVLTIGVGVPGAAGPQGPAGPGVPAGGTAGQFLTKIDGTNYNTDWTTLNLSAYLTKAGNLSGLTDLFAARDNLQLGALYTPTFAGVTAQGSGSNVANLTPTSLTLNQTGYGYFTIQPSQGIRFPDTSVQTTAFPAGSNVPTGGTTGQSLVKSSNSNYAVTWSTIAGQPTSGTVGQVLMKNSGADYDSSWSTLIPGDRYLTTSTTSNSVSNGTKTFTIGTGLSYSSQQDVVISYDASNHMHALVTSYNSGTGVLVVNVQSHTGAGTYSSWTVNVGGTTPLQSVEWGEILGVLGDQTDLATALGNKLETSTAASTYAALAGATFTGEIFTPASTTSNAGLTITPGVAPSAPSNGEIWATTTDLQVRLNGVTETLAEQSWVTGQGYITSSALTPYAPLAGATFTGLISTLAPTTATAGLRLPHGTAPTTPTNGDLWTTTTGLFMRQNGTTQQYVSIGEIQTITGAKTFSGSATFSNANNSFGNSTAAGTTSIASGATISGALKAVNLGTSGVAGSTTTILIGSTTGTSTTTLQGTTNGVTVAADTNSTALATTAYVVGQAGSATPLVNGTAAVGTSLRYARQDHVHPTDTSRAALASPTFTGTPLSTTAAADTNTTQIATTAFVVGQAASTTPSALGTAAVGTSLRYARADHVHPTDTTRLATANNLSELTATASTARTNLGLGTAAVEPATKLVPAGGTTGQALVKLSNADWDDGWATISTGGGTWGSITGTLSSQTDLQSALNAKLDSTTAASTYYPLTGNPSGFLTSAPVTSVAGRTGAITLSNTDISGLGTMATATAADYSTTVVANGLYYPLSGNPSGFLTSAPVSSVAGKTGAVTLVVGDISGAAALAGAAFTGLVTTVASATTGAGLNLPHGAAPTTPVNGDVWSTTSGLFARINGSTRQYVDFDGTQTINGNKTFSNATLVFGNSTATSTTSIATGATISASTKTVNIGTSGVAGSTTNIAIGSTTGTSTTTLNGTVNATTPAALTNTTQIATTAFVRADNNVKAWVNFNGTGTVAIRASFNVSSITDNGVGDYTVNFTTAMQDVNYAATLSGNGPVITDFNNVFVAPYAVAPTTSALRTQNSAGATARDLLHAFVAIFR